MIKIKLLLAEYMAASDVKTSIGRIKAIKSLSILLGNIDYDAEVEATESKEKFFKLLISLNDGPLNSDEVALVDEMFGC